MYFLACSKNPGIITKENLKENIKLFKSYYDKLIYASDNKCTTCNLIK